jgi:NAD(P)-dependent dehydrogenase (short-subunit alcohol dehydrogenase family)
VLLNNAGVGNKGDSFEGLDAWKAVMDVNLFGYVAVLRGNYVADGLSPSILNVQHTFVPVWSSSVAGCAELTGISMLADDSSREPVSHYQHGIQAGHHESSVSIEWKLDWQPLH